MRTRLLTPGLTMAGRYGRGLGRTSRRPLPARRVLPKAAPVQPLPGKPKSTPVFSLNKLWNFLTRKS